ncbi:MAG: helix-turn-helix domain-containing protein [Armatimonadota bacterium]
MENVGAQLWKLRTSRNCSLSELARRAGVSKAALSQWESGARSPRIPELEAVLSALNVDTGQRQRLLAAIDAPRGLRRLRQTALVPPPTIGEFLRALRSRRGWTTDQLAAALSVNRSTIVRWERGERIPSSQQIQAACYALNALEEEFVALTCGPLKEGRNSGPVPLEEIERGLLRQKYGLVNGLDELVLWTLERQAWEQLSHGPEMLRVLADIYVTQGHYYQVHKRWGQIGIYADKARSIIGELPQHPQFRLRTEILQANALVHQSPAPRPHHGVYLLSSVLGSAAGFPEYSAWILSDMAIYREMDGDRDAALDLLVQAITVAQQAENPIEAELRQMNYADMLLRAGRPTEALRILPSAELIGVELLLVRAEAEYRDGNPAEASNTLQQARERIEKNRLSRFRPRANALAALF